MAEGILIGFLILIAVAFTALWLLNLRSDHMGGPKPSHVPAFIALAAVVAAFVFTFT